MTDLLYAYTRLNADYAIVLKFAPNLV